MPYIQARVRVLLLGRNPELSAYRIEALEAAGFEVLAPTSRHEAERAILAGAYDVALLSYSLSNETAQELAELIRQSCPRCGIVAISETGWEDSKIAPDEIVVGSEGPQALIAAVRRAVAKKIRRVK